MRNENLADIDYISIQWMQKSSCYSKNCTDFLWKSVADVTICFYLLYEIEAKEIIKSDKKKGNNKTYKI